MGTALLPSSTFDLEALGQQTRQSCFFCPERLEQSTPKLPPEIHPDGRIRSGQAVLFPNIVTYSQYSSVSIYSPQLHYLPLERMTPMLIADTLVTQVEFISAVMKHDAQARWASINANHMLPSGSSLFHPHMQGAVDRFPTTVQRSLAEIPSDRFRAYIETERRNGERYIGSTGSVHWMASFAPLGFNELRAFVPAVTCPSQLSPDMSAELGTGLAAALNLYAKLGCQSFNAAIYGAPRQHAGYVLNLRLVSRSNLQPLYRSDATYYERLHWQAMVDGSPEELASRAREEFRRLPNFRDG